MDADSRSKTPGVVQVRITLAQQGSKYKEVIKRKTKHHEVVEVDGFNFRRKRKAITPSPPRPLPAAAKARHSPATAVRSTLQLEGNPHASPAAAAYAPGDAEDDATVADQSLAAAEAANEQGFCEAELQLSQVLEDQPADVAAGDELITSADVSPMAVGDDADDSCAGVDDEDVVPATPVRLGPLDFSMAPSELCYLAQWVLTSQLRKLPNMAADAAEEAAADIAKQFAQLLQQRQSTSVDQPRAGPPVTVVAEEAAAEDGGQQEAAQGQHKDPAPAGRPTTLSQTVTVLPYQFEQLKSALKNKLNRLLQEEAAWLHLLQQYNDLAGAGSSAAEANKSTPTGCPGSVDVGQAVDGQDNAAAAAATGAGDPSSTSGGQPADGRAVNQKDSDPAAGDTATAISRQQEHVLRGVALKVEMLTALVSKMEQLVGNAEAAARSLQAAYHVERFKVFPHVNSPATLIRSIISSQQATANESSRGPDSGNGE